MEPQNPTAGPIPVGVIHAPFTPAQVEALNRYQSHGNMHPFTCGNAHDGASVVLIARADGWHCSDPLCDYRQDWAHAFMADPDARPKPFGATARTDVRILNTQTGQGVATGGNDPDVIGWSRTARAGTDESDQSSSDAATCLRLAHEARRAKERQLDDIRRALCDVGAIRDGDPYSHADLADIIRQARGDALVCGLPHAADLAPLVARSEEPLRQTAGLVKEADELEQRAIGIEAENARLRAELERAEATVTRVCALVADMRTWCSWRDMAIEYADRIDEALNGPAREAAP